MRAPRRQGATIFGYRVEDPERYGVVTLDAERPRDEHRGEAEAPSSHWAVIGLYFYDESVVDRVKEVKPSARGEYEITDLNRLYLEDRKLHVELFGRGYAWFDAGHAPLLARGGRVRACATERGRGSSSPRRRKSLSPAAGFAAERLGSGGRARSTTIMAVLSSSWGVRQQDPERFAQATSVGKSSCHVQQSSPDHRRHRPGRRVSGGAPARQRLSRPRRQASLVVVQHRARRPSLCRSARERHDSSCTTAT